MGSTKREGNTRPTRRRELLASLGGALAVAGPIGRGIGGENSTVLRVRTYADGRTGWSATARTAHRAVERGVAAVAAGAERLRDLPVEHRVERGPPLPWDAVSYDSQTDLLAAMRDWLDDTGAPEGPICHLLLADAPLNAVLGYGAADGHVAGDRFGARTIANVGATATYDDLAVTENMAIHETLHTLVKGADAAAVNDSHCEHDLGAVTRLRPGHVVVTPFATSYAAPSAGAETRFPGTGCHDHEAFSRYDRAVSADRVRWYHTSTPSPATKAAVARYLSRSL